jgi:hypothetical protein
METRCEVATQYRTEISGRKEKRCIWDWGSAAEDVNVCTEVQCLNKKRWYSPCILRTKAYDMRTETCPMFICLKSHEANE